MKRIILVAVLLGMAGAVLAETKPSEIRLRDVDFEGMMGVESSLSLIATFDVKREDMFDELCLDFYILLEARDKEMGPQFFHCRTIHRFLEEESGYTSGVVLAQNIKKCINPRDGIYAVVATYRGDEVGLENSEKERWWENADLGKPIENMLTRTTAMPTVREWESE